MRTKWNKIELDDLVVIIENDLNFSIFEDGLNALGELVRRYRELEGKYGSICEQIELRKLKKY